LDALIEAGFPIDLVVSGPDARRGRGSTLTPSPVKARAQESGLSVTDRLEDLFTSTATIGVVVAYGSIVPTPLLAKMPMVNLHFSLLPRWRGAAPVERAILAGDEKTGVCVMAVEEGLDTGGIYASATTEIGDKTLTDLWEELSHTGADLLVTTLEGGLSTPETQIGDVLYAHKLTSEDRHVDWSASPEQIHRVVRLGNAWTTFRGSRMKIHSGTRTAQQFQPTTVQPEGKGPMAFEDWARGVRLQPGEWFE
jgi:methionyl-tRNA formyltransferase